MTSTSFPSENRTWEAQFCGFLQNVNNKAWIISIFVRLRHVSNFSHLHCFTQKRRMRYTNKKRGNGKLKLQQPSSLMFPSHLRKVPNIGQFAVCNQQRNNFSCIDEDERWQACCWGWKNQLGGWRRRGWPFYFWSKLDSRASRCYGRVISN